MTPELPAPALPPRRDLTSSFASPMSPIAHSLVRHLPCAYSAWHRHPPESSSMPLPTNPRRVDMSSTRRSQPSALTRTLDAMEVEPHGEWFELGEGMGNHIPAQLKYAQRRHPGR